MIFVPKWLNLDWKRDINWAAFQDVHWAPEQVRRATKRSEGEIEDKDMLRLVLEGYELAAGKKLTGRKRNEFVASHAGLNPHIDSGSLRRHRREAEKLRAAGEL